MTDNTILNLQLTEDQIVQTTEDQIVQTTEDQIVQTTEDQIVQNTAVQVTPTIEDPLADTKEDEPKDEPESRMWYIAYVCSTLGAMSFKIGPVLTPSMEPYLPTNSIVISINAWILRTWYILKHCGITAGDAAFINYLRNTSAIVNFSSKVFKMLVYHQVADADCNTKEVLIAGRKWYELYYRYYKNIPAPFNSFAEHTSIFVSHAGGNAEIVPLSAIHEVYLYTFCVSPRLSLLCYGIVRLKPFLYVTLIGLILYTLYQERK